MKNITVLGSGVMGKDITTHLLNSDPDAQVHLLDMTPEEAAATGMSLATDAGRNHLVDTALDAIKTGDGLSDEANASRIHTGNFSDDLGGAVRGSEWVIEAITDDPGEKRNLYQRVIPHLNGDAILSTNTSGLPIGELSEHMPFEIQKRFLGTHFFNPVVKMKLLEIIPSLNTSGEITDRISCYGHEVLNKEVIEAKDGPGFVSNRIGTQLLQRVLPMAIRCGPEMIDYVLSTLGEGGKLFVTMDYIGIRNRVIFGTSLAEATAQYDEGINPGILRNPFYVNKMEEAGLLGAAVNAGFYKDKGAMVLNLASFEYEPRKGYGKGGPAFESVKAAKKSTDPDEVARIMCGLEGHDDAGVLIWKRTVLGNVMYALNKVGEITPTIDNIDTAMRYGWNRTLVPGQIARAINPDNLVTMSEELGYTVPADLEQRMQW